MVAKPKSQEQNTGKKAAQDISVKAKAQAKVKAKTATTSTKSKATTTTTTAMAKAKATDTATDTAKESAATKSLSLPKASAGLTAAEKGKTLLNAKERTAVMERLQAQNPNPKSELNFRNPFELICAVVLSAQATDASVNKATPALFATAPDAKSMAALGEDGIASYIKSIGLWRNKAKNLAALATILERDYGGQVPDTYDELIKLPGVGSKTAKVVLNVAFGQPYIAVDTHVFRVCNRTGLCLGKSPQEVEKFLPDLIDERFLKDAHHYLLLHGRYNCTAKKFSDHCATCVVADYCKRNF